MLSSRAKNLKPSPTIALAALAGQLRREGKEVISLTVGEPDWDTFDAVKQAGINAINEGQTKYLPASGRPDLRALIANQFYNDVGIEFTTDCVSVTTGAKFSIYGALQVLCEAGDEVIVPTPYWVSYPAMVELSGAKPVLVESSEETQFKMSAESLQKSITPDTKVVILNSPSNPTGMVYSVEELQKISEILLQHPKILVISDDIYNRLIINSDENTAPHILKVCPRLADRVVVINGVSKSYSMTGWRLGWAIGPKEIIGAMNKLQSQTVSCASSISQAASICAISEGQSDIESSLEVLSARRKLVAENLTRMGFEIFVPQGAFYFWVGLDKIDKWRNKSKEFCQSLLEGEGVMVVPGVDFGMENYFRLSYAAADQTLAQAFEKIERFLNKI